MRKIIVMAVACVLMLFWRPAGALAVSVTLAGWAFHLDDVLSDISPGGDALPSAVDASLFDLDTGLGMLTVTVDGAGQHVVGLLVDHEIEENVNGFTSEFGTVYGMPAAGQSWEIDEPGFAPPFGDIFDHLTDGQLDNTNAIPATDSNDVSMALAWDVLLGPGEAARITFVVSDITGMAVPSGFVLTQTDADPNGPGTIALSSTLSIQSHAVPEPGTWLFLGSGLVGLVVCRRHWRQRAL